MATPTKYAKSISADFTKGKGVNPDLLKDTIDASAIITGLQKIITHGDNVDIWFKDALSGGDSNLLDGIVTNHDGTPTNQETDVFIVQDRKTGKGYNSQMHKLTSTSGAGTTKTVTHTFPVPVSIMKGGFTTEAANKDDEFEVYLDRDTVTGKITQDVSIDDTVINVEQSVADAFRVGFVLKLDDGTNTEKQGVINVDTVAKTITVASGYTQAFSQATPTNCKIQIPFVEKGSVLPDLKGHPLEFGAEALPGQYVEVGTPITIKYKRQASGTADFYYWFGWLF